MKKSIRYLFLLCVLLLSTTKTYAATPNEHLDLLDETKQNIELNHFDFNDPYFETTTYGNEDEEITITTTYLPSLTKETASVGVWKSEVRHKILGVTVMVHSFRYDVSKSGSQWKISNPRDHSYSAPFTTFADPKLSVGRAVSTSSLPAEASASVYINVFDNSWVTVMSGTKGLRVTITSGGTLSSTAF